MVLKDANICFSNQGQNIFDKSVAKSCVMNSKSKKAMPIYGKNSDMISLICVLESILIFLCTSLRLV